MAYTPTDDSKLLRQEIKELEKLAQPVLEQLNQIEQLDAELMRNFSTLGIAHKDLKKKNLITKESTKRRSQSSDSPNENLIRVIKKLHSFISLAVTPETSLQFKEFLAQQIIMQNDMLERLYEFTPDGSGENIITAVNTMPTTIAITEKDRKARVQNLNQKLHDKLHIDEGTIISNLNILRDARESIMEQFVKNLAEVLHNYSTQKKLPVQKKIHVFSAPGKESIGRQSPASQVNEARRDVITDIKYTANAVIDMADDIINKVNKQAADRLIDQQNHCDKIAGRATSLSASDSMSELLILAVSAKLSCELVNCYLAVEQEASHAKTGERFQRLRDTAKFSINKTSVALSTFFDLVTALEKNNNTYKDRDFVEIKKDLTALSKITPSNK